MKKVLVSSILGLATAASVFAQGNVSLDTYGGSGQLITYGAGSGGSTGQPIAGGFNASLYYFVAASSGAATTFAGTVNSSFDGTGYDIPSGMTAALTSDTGAVAPISGGYIIATDGYTVPGTTAAPADSFVTVVVVAYNGATYATSTVRGHSAAFAMTAKSLGAPDSVAPLMNTFSVFSVAAVPEPSTFALAGLGLASLVIFRRRK